MSVLAVIPCLDEEQHLPGLLARLSADSALSWIVVADGGSRDRSRAIVREWQARDPRIRLLDNPDRVQASGVNRAVAAWGEGCRWLLRMDAHCGYPDRFAPRLLETAERHGATSVVVPMRTIGRTCFQRAAAAAQNSPIGTGGSAHRHMGMGRFVDHGHHALMDMAMFQRVGGYCAAMACNEDAELDHRLAQAGGRIWLEPTAAIDYLPRATPTALWRQYLRHGAGRARTVARHGTRLKSRQTAPLLVPFALAVLPLAPFHWLAAMPASLWAGVALLGGALAGIRQGGGCALFAGFAAMIMHAAWGAGYLLERLRHPKGVSARHGFTPSLHERAAEHGL